MMRGQDRPIREVLAARRDARGRMSARSILLRRSSWPNIGRAGRMRGVGARQSSS